MDPLEHTAPLPSFIEVAKAHAYAIGERSGARQPGGWSLDHRRHEEASCAARKREHQPMVDWIGRRVDRVGHVAALHTLRRETESFYDSTTAYRTIIDIIECANDVFDAVDGTEPEVATSLDMLRLLTLDINIFEAIQRSDASQAFDSATTALGAVAAITACSEPLALELRVLRIYYDGLTEATRAMKVHDESASAGEIPSPAHLSESAVYLRRAVRDLLEERSNDGIPRALLDEIHELAEMLASRLKPWAATFEAMAEKTAVSRTVLKVDALEICYCYPFALHLDANDHEALSDALDRAAKAQSTSSQSAHETLRTHGALANLLSGLEGEFLVDDGVGIDPLTECEMWGGAGEVTYDGASIRLASFIINEPTARETLAPTLKLSILGNHCLVIRRQINRPTPPQLYAALRAGGDFVPQPGRVCPKTSGDGSRTREAAKQEWRSLHLFADDVIKIVRASLSARSPNAVEGPSVATAISRKASLSVPTRAHAKGSRPATTPTAAPGLPDHGAPPYRRDEVHIIALLNTEDPQAHTSDRDRFLGWLAHAYGGSILTTNANRVAASLNEWVRLPTRDAVIAAPQFGYLGDWMLATSDMTLIFNTGTPTWRAEALVEAAQFAASCSAQLLMWGQELLNGETLERADVRRLRETQLASEQFIASISSKALCWSRAHRELLDVLLTTTGASALAQVLERQLSVVQAVLDDELRDQREQERSMRDTADRRRNILLALIAIFGVFNLSTFSQLINQNPSTDYWLEVVVQLSLAVVAVALLLTRTPVRDLISSARAAMTDEQATNETASSGA